MNELIQILTQYCKNESSKGSTNETLFKEVFTNKLIIISVVFFIFTIAMLLVTIYIENAICTYIGTTSFLVAITLLFGFIVGRGQHARELINKLGNNLENIKTYLNLHTSEIPEIFSINNFQLKNNATFKMLVTVDDKFLLGYSIPDEEFYVSKKNLENKFGDNFKEYFKDYNLEDLPSFNSNNNNIEKVVEFLKKLK